MLLPLVWLKEYLPTLPSVEKLMERLMMHGLEVERVIETSRELDRVVVGEIVGIKPHPNADKLRLAEVVVTAGGRPQEIVCGAPNIAVGQKVPVALLGARLPNGVTIEPRSIRGVTSNGMICAEDELGLGPTHAGILVLDRSLNLGSSFAQAMGLDQPVLDLAIPANRADLMAMRGLAWEIGAMLGKKPKYAVSKRPPLPRPGKTALKHNPVSVKITDPKLCRLLTARVIRGVTLRPTPAWMVSRLRAAGMRSINIIADITNYVMLDYGQPLHAYDAARVHGATLIARPAKSGEQLKTLDGKTRALTAEMLVIADVDRAIGIAGVMGGEESEVTSATTDIILEAAIFDPVTIRKTSRHLGLVSEASKRFEKGLWPSLPAQANAAAADLMVELCGGTADSESVQVGMANVTTTTVTLHPDYISERLGKKVPVAKVKTLLTKLGFRVKGTAKAWQVQMPEWRLDVSRPEDIVDEVGRMTGYDALPSELPPAGQARKALPPAIRFREELKNMLVDMGLTEVVSHAFYGTKEASGDTRGHFEIANPLDKTQQVLRKSLSPQIQEVLRREADAGHDAMIFEIGRVFDPSRKGQVEDQQPWKIALGAAHKEPALQLEAVEKKIREFLKAHLQPEIVLVDQLVRGRRLEYCEMDIGELMSDAKVQFGPWDPDRHIVRDVFVHEQSKFPAVKRDIAFWWPGETETILEFIDNLSLPLLRAITFKDKFIKDGKTSYAYTFIYQSSDRTLTKAEVDKLEQKIKDALVKLGATIR